MTDTAALSLDRYSNRRRPPLPRPATRFPRNLAGHFWTIGPALRAALMPPAEIPSRPFQAVVHDSAIGPVRLSGMLCDASNSDTMVVIIHGISGNAHSPYCLAAAKAVAHAGHASLRISMRGADLSGEDIYNGGVRDAV